VQPLAELPLAAHAVERDQEAGFEQRLRRDGGPPPLGVEGVEQGREPRQFRIGQCLDAPDRVIWRNPPLRRHQTQHRFLPHHLTPHPHVLPRASIDPGPLEVERIAHFSAPC